MTAREQGRNAAKAHPLTADQLARLKVLGWSTALAKARARRWNAQAAAS